MSETTAPTGGSNVLNDKKQQELYVQRCNDVLEKMTNAGYRDVVLNIMEARMKDSFEKEQDSEETDTTSDDTSVNNDKKQESSLLIGNLPYKKIPFGPYIDLLQNPANFTERGVKGNIRAKTISESKDGPVNDEK